MCDWYLILIMNEELIEALENRLEHGEDKESLRAEVLAAGHTDEAFEEAFLEANRRYQMSGGGEDSEVSFADTVEEAEMSIPHSRARGDLHTLKISRPAQDSGLVRYTELMPAGWLICTGSVRQLGGFLSSLLALVVLVVIAVLAMGGYIASDAFVDSDATLVALLVLAALGYLLIILYASVAGFAFLRSLILRREEPHFWTHFWWSWRRVIPIFLLSFYVQIITQAGFVLFVIPGFIAMIYLGYAQYSLANHDIRGFDALIRSFELVYGRFWAILGRKLFLIATIFGVAFFEVLLLSVSPFLGLLGALAFVLSLYVVFCSAVALYESVTSVKPVHIFSEHDTASLKRWLMVVVLVGLLFGAISLFNMVSDIETSQQYPEIEQIIDTIRNAKDGDGATEQLLNTDVDAAKINLITSYLEEVPATAELYKGTTGSYAGVCSDEDGVNTLLRYAYDAGSNDIFCHDDRDYFIAEAELVQSGVYYCVDSTGNSLMQQHSRNGYEICIDEWMNDDLAPEESSPES